MTHSVPDGDTGAFVYSHNPYHETDFPLLVLDVKHRVCTPENEGFQILHWHEEVQFVHVISGTVHITVYNEAYDLEAGDCMFLNCMVLHHITEVRDCHYHSFLIPPRMLSFFPGSKMEQNDVAAITSDPSFTCRMICKENPVHRAFLSELKQLDSLYFSTEKDSRHEYRLSISLTKLWLAFITLPAEQAHRSKTSPASYLRIRTLLAAIHSNYEKNLTVDEIAKAAHVSKTECLRCFQKFVQESPYQYLIKYRLHRSTSLLLTTDRSVTDIALSVGFRCASSYIKYFRQVYGTTPHSYRTRSV